MPLKQADIIQKVCVKAADLTTGKNFTRCTWYDLLANTFGGSVEMILVSRYPYPSHVIMMQVYGTNEEGNITTSSDKFYMSVPMHAEGESVGQDEGGSEVGREGGKEGGGESEGRSEAAGSYTGAIMAFGVWLSHPPRHAHAIHGETVMPAVISRGDKDSGDISDNHKNANDGSDSHSDESDTIGDSVDTVSTRAHSPAPSKATCPVLVYVYQMPERFLNPLGLNNPVDVSIYAAEWRLHRLLAAHPCRTKFPSAADFFYVPVLACHTVHRTLGKEGGANLQAGFDMLQVHPLKR